MTSFGVIFTTLGVVLFFDKLLLSMGNVGHSRSIHTPSRPASRISA